MYNLKICCFKYTYYVLLPAKKVHRFFKSFREWYVGNYNQVKISYGLWFGVKWRNRQRLVQPQTLSAYGTRKYWWSIGYIEIPRICLTHKPSFIALVGYTRSCWTVQSYKAVLKQICIQLQFQVRQFFIHVWLLFKVSPTLTGILTVVESLWRHLCFFTLNHNTGWHMEDGRILSK